jgi:hypothetical protein
MKNRITTTKKVALALLIASTIHAILFYLGWYLEIRVSVIILLATFWTSVILFFVSLAWVKRDPKFILAAVIYSMVAIVPTAEACLAWSIWSIVGFAP